MTIGDIMTSIAGGLSPEDRLYDAVMLMREHNISCVVVSENGYPKGILTERDVVKVFAGALDDQLIPESSIGDVMVTEPVCIPVSTPVNDALLLSRNLRLRHLIVVDEDELLMGLVTHTDMVDAYLKLIKRQSDLETENQALQLLSNEDALMGIGNHRAMDVELAFTEAAARRYKKSYAIALMDVDFFKKYNDRYGHQMGDKALQALAIVIKRAMRDSDRVYRYGGEEILLLMPETNTREAVIAAERIRLEVEAMKLPHEDSPFAFLTISVGVTAGNQQSWQQLVKRADAALYEAKDGGRNRVVEAS